MSKLSDVVKQAEFAARKKAARVDIHTEESGAQTAVVKFKGGGEKYMHSADVIEVDWWPERQVLEQQKRIYEQHRR